MLAGPCGVDAASLGEVWGNVYELSAALDTLKSRFFVTIERLALVAAAKRLRQRWRAAIAQQKL